MKIYAISDLHLSLASEKPMDVFGEHWKDHHHLIEKNWKELATGLPTIAVRDIAIQERENDLALGTFGRGFYILDDYSALRTVDNTAPEETAIIYPIRDSLSWEKTW